MATIFFRPDWSDERIGALRAGEQLKIEYDAARLPECRASRYGQPAWTITASVRFHPGGQEQSGPVQGGPLEVTVPAGTTQVELWFYNSDVHGCKAWDSRYGQNYWLSVD
jgi:hypothetical protein